jgi:hypothetical protein
MDQAKREGVVGSGPLENGSSFKIVAREKKVRALHHALNMVAGK